MTKEITKVELFCDDNSVGAIQRMLSRVKGVYDVRTVPVVNAEAKANGTVKATTDGNLASQFTSFVAGRDSITPSEVKGWLETVGRSPLSVSYVIRAALDAHVLGKKRADGAYPVRARK